MLTKEEILRKMNGFECPEYLVTPCWQPIYDQCVAAIDLVAENKRLKAKLDAVRELAIEETYGTANMSWSKAMKNILGILDRDGDGE